MMSLCHLCAAARGSAAVSFPSCRARACELSGDPRPRRRCVFYYAGAARAAGASYRGSILASRSGEWPDEAARPRIAAALAAAGIRMWELSNVTNTRAPAPLEPAAELLAPA
jgi:hypothetical protein